MAKYLRPRRGTKTNANGQNILLKRGEIFLEFQGNSIGNSAGRLIVGDGATSYTNITPFIEDPSIYRPRFNNSTYETSNYTVEYNNAIASKNKIDGSQSSNVTLNDDIEYIKQTLCYNHDTLMATTNVFQSKAQNALYSASSNGLIPTLPTGASSVTKYLRNDRTWSIPPNDNTTYDVATTAGAGLVPALPANATSVTKFLAADGVWRVPPDTLYYFPNSTRNGLCRQFDGTTYRYLRGDNTWATPPNDNTTYPMSNSCTSAGTATMFTSQGIRDFLVNVTDLDAYSSTAVGGPLCIFNWHSAGDGITIGPNSAASVWQKAVYQPSDGLTLIGGRIESNNYFQTRSGAMLPVKCEVDIQNGEYGLSYQIKNMSTSQPLYFGGTLTEIYLRDSIS